MKRQHPTDPNLFWCPKCQGYKERHEYDQCKTMRYGIGVYCKACRRKIRNKTDRIKRNLSHPDDPNLRMCGQCATYKDIGNFNSWENGRISPYCKQCATERTRIWVQTNQEKHAEWIEVSKPRNNERKREDYARHREKRLRSCAEYRVLHPEVHRRANNKYRNVNKNEINRKNLERAKEAYKNDPEKYKERNRKYCVLLHDTYIKSYLSASGISISPETIELKRQQIIAKRTLKQLKEWRKEHESDRNVISGEQREDETVNEVNRGCEETGHGCDCSVSAGM